MRPATATMITTEPTAAEEVKAEAGTLAEAKRDTATATSKTTATNGGTCS